MSCRMLQLRANHPLHSKHSIPCFQVQVKINVIPLPHPIPASCNIVWVRGQLKDRTSVRVKVWKGHSEMDISKK